MSRITAAPRTLFGPYTRLFVVPGARTFSLAGWVARMPASMISLGALLLVAQRSGSYALAGAMAGICALSFAVASPQWARAMDRRGQGAVLRIAMVGFAVSGVAFVAVVVGGAPQWSWFALSAATGLCSPNVGSLVRARWAAGLPDPAQRRTAFAFESVVDEVVFVVGPPLVTLLATLIAPAVGFLTGIVLGTAGGLWLAGRRDTEPAAHGEDDGAPPSRWAALPAAAVVVTVSYLAIGCVFGAMDVVVVGFATAEGAPPMAGLSLAVYAFGSLVAGLVYGVVRLPGTLTARFLVAAGCFGVAAQALLTVGSLAVLVPAGFLAGLTVAPALISGMSLVEDRVPRRALTEALSWTTTGLTLGVTAGSAVAGVAVDRWGAESAFIVPALGAALAAVLALAGAALLRHRAPVAAAGPLPDRSPTG